MVLDKVNELSFFWLVALPLLPTFICGSLLRAQGAAGVFALMGIIAVAVTVFVNLQGWRLAVGAIAVLAGMALGGKVSDYREHQRVTRLQEEENRKRDALLGRR